MDHFLAVHPVGRLERHMPVDLAESGIDEGVNLAGSGVVVQSGLCGVLDLAHNRGDDLGHPLWPAAWRGLASELSCPGVACDDDFGVVGDEAELCITPRLHDADTHVLEDAAVGDDDAVRGGLAVALERAHPVERRKEGGIGGRSGDGVGNPEFACWCVALSPRGEAFVAHTEVSGQRRPLF